MRVLELHRDDCGVDGKVFWIVNIGAAQCINGWLIVALFKAWWRFRAYRNKQNTAPDRQEGVR